MEPHLLVQSKKLALAYIAGQQFARFHGGATLIEYCKGLGMLSVSEHF